MTARRIELGGLSALHWPGRGPLTVLLHGFGGEARVWLELVAAHRERAWLAVDLLGHGRSEAPGDPARYHAACQAEQLAASLRATGHRSARWIGYSMGARLALQIAIAHPAVVQALVLESGSAGIVDLEARRERQLSDERWARMLEENGLEAFVDAWLQQPLFSTQRRLSAAVRNAEKRRRLAADVRALAASLRGFGQGIAPPLWDRLQGVTVPTRILAGALDDRYCRLALCMAAALPRAELRVIEGSGHTCHLERPALFASAVDDFLDEIDSSSIATKESP